MRKFRTYVITKKGIYRAAAAAAVIAAFSLGTAAVVKNIPEPAEQEAVTAYSPAEDELYKAILDDGLPENDGGSGIGDMIKRIFGFDADKPDTIIESSSAVLEAAGQPGSSERPEADTENKSDPVPSPEHGQEQEQKQDIIKSAASKLPSHEEITASAGLEINNATNYSVDIDAMCAGELASRLTLDAPEVLIVHTHTTECYDGDAMSGESERTTNPDQNMCAVGDIIAQTLEAHGIQTIHDTTIHDYPTYQSAYTRTLETINKNIEQYPSIKVVLDVHRDAYIYNDGSKLRVCAEVNGGETAQVMLVIGTDSMGLYHPHWRDNLTLAAKVQNAAELMYPGMMRPINLRRERFNMHVTRGSLLLEVGSNGNSLAEAKTAAVYIADAIAAALLNG